MTDEYLHPLVVDGVRHASNCRLFAYWNGRDEPEKCSCGAGYSDPKDPTVKITHIDRIPHGINSGQRIRTGVSE